ncbi:MAG: class I SAM-dependent methyltransferase [Streptosporangiaceae bacterium]
MPGIYDEPEFYQAACAYRNVPDEVDALLRWAGAHRSPDAGPPRSVLELAAGPAEHARELARRGLSATALDLSPAMCGRARDLAKAAGIQLTVVEADMRDFSLPGPVDLAITMLNSLCHLLTLDDMLAHLGCVARHLRSDGLYIAELAHPADFLAAEHRTSSEWNTEVSDGIVSVRWGAHDHTDVVPNRFWTATEMVAAVRLAGAFTIEASYGDFDADVPVDAAEAWRMILVLRRSPAVLEAVREGARGG